VRHERSASQHIVARKLTRAFPLHQTAIVLLVVLTASGSLAAQRQRVDLLLPGDEYHRNDLPPDPSGTWWILHQSAGEVLLEATQIDVASFPTCGDEVGTIQSGRAVRVPFAYDTTLLVRGLDGVRSGVVRTAFIDGSGAGVTNRVDAPWNEATVVVRRVVNGPHDDTPGEYQIKLQVGAE